MIRNSPGIPRDMTRISFVNCFVLLALFLCFASENGDCLETPNDHGHREASPMWFGPRIGRKKRNPVLDNKVYRNDKDQTSLGLLDVLRESPLVVVAVNEANKQHNFTPRLGRELGESLPNWAEDAEFVDADSFASRPVNPFNPRLGRNSYNPFSPRLGRESEAPLK